MSEPENDATSGWGGLSDVDRIASVASFGVLDTPPEKAFDDLTELAAQICGTSMALVSLVDDRRQWFKSCYGLDDMTETPREQSFCSHALNFGDVFEVKDTKLDERFRNNSLVVGQPFIRFYAGAPLRSAEGYALGTLCVLDAQPRQLSSSQKRCLQVLAAQAMDQLEMRRQAQRMAVEVAARVASEAALSEQQRLLEAVLEHTDVLIYAKDLQGRFVMTSAALEHVTQVPGGLLGHTDHELFDRDTAAGYRRNDERIIGARDRKVFTEELIHPDGSTHTYHSTKFPLLDDDGTVLGVAGVSTDVTELVKTRAAHQQAEHRWRALIEQSPVAMLVVDDSWHVTYLNPQAKTFCAAPADQFVDRFPLGAVVDGGGDLEMLLATVLHGGDPLRGHHLGITRGDGTRITVELHATRIHYHGGAAVQLELRDVTDAVADRAELQRHAETDPLTGLLNRRGWALRLPGLLDHHDQRHLSLVVAMIDLDRFKVYNDRRGHDAGDRLLAEFAGAVRALLAGADVIARWGGEEFVIAMPHVDVDQARQTLSRISASVPDGQTCSIGYTHWQPSETLTTTVARADASLYESKNGGRNRIAYAPLPNAVRHLPAAIRTRIS